MLEINTVYQDNCNQILSQIENNSVDAIITDPPYQIDYQKIEWDSSNIDLSWGFLFTEFKRILKPTGNLIIFQGWTNVGETQRIGKEYFILNNSIIYDRIKGRGGKRNLTSTREDILWFSPTNKYTFNKIYSNIPKKTKGLGTKNGQLNRSLSNVWTDCSPIVPWSSEYTGYPCQKPLSLAERCVTVFSNEGNLILDCFCGSGSFLVAAKNLNRNFIGIDNNTEAIRISKQRLEI